MIQRRLLYPFILLAVTYALGSESSRIDDLKRAFARPDSIPAPKDNQLTESRVSLGKALFFEPRISGSGILSCASCHNPSLDWEDGLPRSVGHQHKMLDRSTPTLLNVAWNSSNFWDGRADTLEDQALAPIESSTEMNADIEVTLQTLGALPQYVGAFETAYPGEGITKQTVAKAISSFERTIVSGTAPFDRWIEGDESAISDSAKNGFLLFNTKAACVKCHSGWNFTNGSFHDIGVISDDLGRGGVLGIESMNHTFKTPTLRNVARRAPYTHNGSEATLRNVIELYNQGGRIKRATLSSEIKTLGLSQDEVDDLIAFLDTLTSDDHAPELPKLPR